MCLFALDALGVLGFEGSDLAAGSGCHWLPLEVPVVFLPWPLVSL